VLPHFAGITTIQRVIKKSILEIVYFIKKILLLNNEVNVFILLYCENIRDCRYHKEDPSIIVKWMRRNFGERHQGWDFSLAGGCVTIEIWDDRLMTMYEMWQM
jgi:hypothetical protein